MSKELPFWDQVRAARAMLEIHHPGLFSLETPVPLSIGIRWQIADAYPQIPADVVRKMMWWLTRRRAYLSTCTGGAPRMGLVGLEGEVTAQQAAFARNMHAKREAEAQAKTERRAA